MKFYKTSWNVKESDDPEQDYQMKLGESQPKNQYSQKPGSCMLFINKRKQTNLQPDMNGQANINGHDTYIQAWEATSGQNKEFYECKITSLQDKTKNSRFSIFPVKNPKKNSKFYGFIPFGGDSYMVTLWEKSTSKCPLFYSGKVNKTN